MFVTGFLHSGVSIVRDFLSDVSDFKIDNGGDECYFLREIGGGVDRIYPSEPAQSVPVKQMGLRYKAFLFKRILLNEITAKQFASSVSYNLKCHKYWKKISEATDKHRQLELVSSFYSASQMIYLNAVSLDMPNDLVGFLLNRHKFIFPLRNIYSQLRDIEEQNYFFGPFSYNVEYILGRGDLQFQRRLLYLNVLSYRLSRLKDIKKHENAIIVDVEKLLLKKDYRRLIGDRLGLNVVEKKYNNLKLDKRREWLNYDKSEFMSDKKYQKLYGQAIDKVTDLQKEIRELKCG
jgi:uncharacterized membrane protein